MQFARDKETGDVLRDAGLLARLSGAYREIKQLTEEKNTAVFDLWRYPYDCNNVKAAIKCFIRGIDPVAMLLDFGTVSIDEIQKAVRSNDFSALPSHMQAAAGEAVKIYSKTRNPQQIDFMLDRACYMDMLDAAEKSGVEYAVKLVKSKIDLINLAICVRALRMQSGEAGKTLLSDALLDGGTLDHAFLLELYAMEERQLWERLLYTDYKRFAEAISTQTPTLTEVERAADNAFMELVREAKFIACGPEVLIGYLLGVECEVRNLRIILAGKAAGLNAETVMERIRESYV